MTLETVLKDSVLRNRRPGTGGTTGNTLFYDLRYKASSNTFEAPWGWHISKPLVPQLGINFSPNPYVAALPKTPLSILYNTIGSTFADITNFGESTTGPITFKSVFGLLVDGRNNPILEFTQVIDANTIQKIKYKCRINKTYLDTVNNKFTDYIKGSLIKNLLTMRILDKGFDVHIWDFKSPLSEAALPLLDETAHQNMINNIIDEHSEEIIANIIQ